MRGVQVCSQSRFQLRGHARSGPGPLCQPSIIRALQMHPSPEPFLWR